MEEREYIKTVLPELSEDQINLILNWIGDAYNAGYEQVTYRVNED